MAPLDLQKYRESSKLSRELIVPDYFWCRKRWEAERIVSRNAGKIFQKEKEEYLETFEVGLRTYLIPHVVTIVGFTAHRYSAVQPRQFYHSPDHRESLSLHWGKSVLYPLF